MRPRRRGVLDPRRLLQRSQLPARAMLRRELRRVGRGVHGSVGVLPADRVRRGSVQHRLSSVARRVRRGRGLLLGLHMYRRPLLGGLCRRGVGVHERRAVLHAEPLCRRLLPVRSGGDIVRDVRGVLLEPRVRRRALLADDVPAAWLRMRRPVGLLRRGLRRRKLLHGGRRSVHVRRVLWRPRLSERHAPVRRMPRPRRFVHEGRRVLRGLVSHGDLLRRRGRNVCGAGRVLRRRLRRRIVLPAPGSDVRRRRALLRGPHLHWRRLLRRRRRRLHDGVGLLRREPMRERHVLWSAGRDVHGERRLLQRHLHRRPLRLQPRRGRVLIGDC